MAVYRKLIQDIEADARDILAEPGISAKEAAYNMLKMFYKRLKEDPRRAQVQLFEVLGVSPRVNREYQSAMKTLADWIKLLVATFFPGLEEKLPERTILHTGAAGAIIEIANQWETTWGPFIFLYLLWHDLGTCTIQKFIGTKNQAYQGIKTENQIKIPSVFSVRGAGQRGLPGVQSEFLLLQAG